MKTNNLIPVVVAALLLSGCIPSVNPFYTEKDLLFDPRLLGTWQHSPQEPEVWTFAKAGDQAYKLIVTDEKGRGEFYARLFKLKQQLFLDLIPSDCDYATNQVELVAFCMFRGHLLLRVLQLEPELKFAAFDFDWLQKFLKANPKALAHHLEDEAILLTASTRDLQRFVMKHLGEGELFQTPAAMVRRTDPPGR